MADPSGMLVLQRDLREGHNEIVIEGGITITVLGVDRIRGNVSIGVRAPKQIGVDRAERLKGPHGAPR